MSTIKRQFIAAARCPACQAVDRIRRCHETVSGREWIECVACAYQEERPTAPASPVPERGGEGVAVTVALRTPASRQATT